MSGQFEEDLHDRGDRKSSKSPTLLSSYCIDSILGRRSPCKVRLIGPQSLTALSGRGELDKTAEGEFHQAGGEPERSAANNDREITVWTQNCS